LNEQKHVVAKLKSELEVAKPLKTVRFEIPDRRIERLEEQLVAKEKEVATIRAENEQLFKDQSTMRKAIQEQTTIVQSLKADLEGEVEEELKLLAEENERLEEQRASMEAELDREKELVVQLKLDLKQARPSELERLDEETDSEIGSIASQLEVKEREMAALRAENKRLVDGQNDATKHIETQRAVVEKLKADLEDEIEREINSLKVSCYKQIARFLLRALIPHLCIPKKLQERNDYLEEQLVALRKENQELVRESMEMQDNEEDQSLATIMEEEQSLANELRELRVAAAKAASDLKEAKARELSNLKAANKTNESIVQQLNNAKQEIAKIQRENQRLRDEQKELEQTIQERKETNQRLQKSLSDAEERQLDPEKVFHQMSEKEQKLRGEKAALEVSLQDRLRNLTSQSLFPF
jgi:chromosome segregation ATPase